MREDPSPLRPSQHISCSFIQPHNLRHARKQPSPSQFSTDFDAFLAPHEYASESCRHASYSCVCTLEIWHHWSYIDFIPDYIEQQVCKVVKTLDEHSCSSPSSLNSHHHHATCDHLTVSNTCSHTPASDKVSIPTLSEFLIEIISQSKAQMPTILCALVYLQRLSRRVHATSLGKFMILLQKPTRTHS